MATYNLNLNFVSLINTNFRIVCYRKRIVLESEERPFPDVARYRLPSGSQEESWPLYWISLDAKEDWERFEFLAQDNHVAALWVLNHELLPHLKRYISSFSSNYLTEIVDGHFTTLNVKLKRHTEGWQGIRFELKYLKEKRQLGAIVNYHFFADTDKKDLNRRKILELSFSFDSSGHSNKNFYVDRFKWESAFVRKFLMPYKYMPTEAIPDEIVFNSAFSMLSAFTLSEREYDFAGGGRNNVQYWGLTKYGPCETPRNAPKFYFVFRKQDKAAAISLYKALAGKTYPGRFSGMEQVFKVGFSGDAISSCEIDDFSRSSMEKAARFVKDKGDANAVCIALIDDEAETYYSLKASFLAQCIATQNVRLDSVIRNRSFEWFIAGIGLQIFCKAMGRPWKVRTQNKNDIIVGISQAFGSVSNGIQRYISYSVTTDASGVFKDINTLADSQTDKDYIEALADNLERRLRRVIQDGGEAMCRVVLHCSFKLPKAMMQRIRSVVEKVAGEGNAPQIVILRINTDHEYAGYDVSQASLVPRECSYVSLGGNKYILWCDGVKRNKSIAKRPCAPLHVCFDQSFPQVTQSDRISILGDVSNLAGANWRGFNASTQPVSVFYCRIVGEFIKEFSERGLPVPSVEECMPWFL